MIIIFYTLKFIIKNIKKIVFFEKKKSKTVRFLTFLTVEIIIIIYTFEGEFW